VEDTSDEDDDEETLQDRFQLRSRFSRPGLPHVPLVQDPPASLEASLAAPPRRPRNPARKRVSKKLKVSQTTPQEVSHALLQPRRSSRLLVSRQHWLYFEFAARCHDIVFWSHRIDHSSRLVFQTSQERQSRPQQLVGINSD
jgi:hypothetical protein